MRIHHVTQTLSNGDAVSNNLVAIVKLLDEKDIDGYIFCEQCHRRKDEGIEIIDFNEIDKHIKAEDIIIYHKSIGTKLTDKIAKLKNKVIVVYHNITPAEYFEGYNDELVKLLAWGRRQLKSLENCLHFICDSDYNKEDLIKEGIDESKMSTIPLLINFDDYQGKYDSELYNKMNDGKVNILFVGRVSPNKKHEDIIKSFNYYKKFINNESRLILVGGWTGVEKYHEELSALVNQLRLTDVHFCSHIPFSKILAYYKSADVFLCMSEHEGFCVPLLEAMSFEVPVIAYDCAAVPETLGGSSVVIKEKDYPLIAATIEEVIENTKLRKNIIARQTERLKYFEKEKIEKMTFEKLMSIINM